MMYLELSSIYPACFLSNSKLHFFQIATLSNKDVRVSAALYERGVKGRDSVPVVKLAAQTFGILLTQ
jgi:hypothetical protein